MNKVYYLSRLQFFSLLATVILFAFLSNFIRRKKLLEEYSILWFLIFLIFLFFAVFGGLLEALAKFLGIIYPPAALFIILIIGLFLLMLHFSIIISELKIKVNKLSIKLALLEHKNLKKDDDK